MANSDFLRQNLNQHAIKNSLSFGMEKDIDQAIAQVLISLSEKYPALAFRHQKQMPLATIIAGIAQEFPEYAPGLGAGLKTSFIKPDGGFIYAEHADGRQKIVLVSEVKRQGTNDKRAEEGKPKQAKGNAIERLGKNLTGIRAIFKSDDVLPFVCFGQGKDFEEGSSILDRVLTLNDFFPLNKTFVHKSYKPFEPASMYFRYEDWTVEEMTAIMLDIAIQAVDEIFGPSAS